MFMGMIVIVVAVVVVVIAVNFVAGWARIR